MRDVSIRASECGTRPVSVRARTSKRSGVSGFLCTGCNRWHAFGVYVLGHPNDELVHTCECGAKHSVLNFAVERIER